MSYAENLCFHLAVFFAGAISLSAVAFFDDRFQIFLPDDSILHRILDEAPVMPPATILRSQNPSPKCAESAVRYKQPNRFSRAERSGRRL